MARRRQRGWDEHPILVKGLKELGLPPVVQEPWTAQALWTRGVPHNRKTRLHVKGRITTRYCPTAKRVRRWMVAYVRGELEMIWYWKRRPEGRPGVGGHPSPGGIHSPFHLRERGAFVTLCGFKLTNPGLVERDDGIPQQAHCRVCLFNIRMVITALRLRRVNIWQLPWRDPHIVEGDEVLMEGGP